MLRHVLSRSALAVVATLAASCSVSLSVRSTTKEVVLREPVPGPVSFDSAVEGATLCIRVRRHDRERVQKFEVETRERYRCREPSGGESLLDALLLPCSAIYDLADVCAAAFDSERDVAYGLLGGVAAIVVPGVKTTDFSPRSPDNLWDTSTSRRLLSSVLAPAERGVVTDLRVVTDREVLDVRTDSAGKARIPLVSLLADGKTSTRVTVAHGADLYAIRIDNGTATCTPAGSAPPQ